MCTIDDMYKIHNQRETTVQHGELQVVLSGDLNGKEIQKRGDICIHIANSQVMLVVKNPPANAEDTRNTGQIPRSRRSPGGGNGNPLQYSCLENSKDRGDWQATVCGVTRSWTQLKQLSTAQYTTKEARIYNRGETVSSINVAGKTGQLHAKVSNWITLLYHAQK